MPPRKKLHEDIFDGEEDYCPKRKIKKLDIEDDASSKIFNNQNIVHEIIEHLVGNDKSILDFLLLRLVSKSFNSVVLSKIRAEFVQVQVSPLQKSEANGEYSDNEDVEYESSSFLQDRLFTVNERTTSFSKSSKLFEFLNSVARIRVRDLLFSGFTSTDKRLHDCILYSLLAANWFSLASYKGADEVCNGCAACREIASRVKVYGPVQLCTLIEPISGRKHYEQLIVTEILLAEIAYHCVEMIGSKEEAFVRLAKIINLEISCDQLDLVFSDRCMWSKDTLAHPREVIDWIIKAWKVKSINIRFMTGYSSIDYKQWACKRIFTEMRFDEMFVKDQNSRSRSDRDHFERVEVDMQAGDEIATCFAESMGMFERSGMSSTAFQNVCANVKRIFPTQDMYLILPVELAHVASVEFDGFCEALLEFAWKDEQTARHSRLFFRLYTFGITEKEVMRQIKKQFKINCRPVAAMLSDPSVRCSFLKWLPGSTSTFDRSLLSFTDTSNNCVLHLEVCVEPA
uniref:F-box domain-containing protein n=1 Tax=Caenorhabditis tropicalis TaxID=1561998 RepID=A0A1I7U6H5_9PELO